MVDDDVPPSPGPILGPPNASPGRFILQHFTPQDDYTIRNSPHNQDARLPADMSEFPAPIIVEMFYGCVALLRWGIPQASDAIWLLAGSLYYDETGSRVSNKNSLGGAEGDTEAPKRANVRASRQCDKSEPHTGLPPKDNGRSDGFGNAFVVSIGSQATREATTNAGGGAAASRQS